MCLDDSNEVAKLQPPVVITETDGIRVEFYDKSQVFEALELLINAAVKHGKPVNLVLRPDPSMIMAVKWQQ